MNKKKNNKNSKKRFPFSNEIKMLKDAFKKSIDEMSDENFLDLVSFLMFSAEDLEDEDWEDETKKSYNKVNNKTNNSNQINDDDLPF